EATARRENFTRALCVVALVLGLGSQAAAQDVKPDFTKEDLQRSFEKAPIPEAPAKTRGFSLATPSNKDNPPPVEKPAPGAGQANSRARASLEPPRTVEARAR